MPPLSNMTELNGKEAQRFTRLLTERGLKLTRERELLLHEVQKTTQHFDADSLYEKLQRHQVRIARDTVYRTLPLLLLECGVIQKSVGDGRRDYFERTGPRGHHDHMVCVSCRKVIEFKSEAIEQMQEQVCADNGFQLLFHDHRLFGHCRDCARLH